MTDVQDDIGEAEARAGRTPTGQPLTGVVAAPEPMTGVEELSRWWKDRVLEEIEAVVPKAIEYGSNSMIEVGRSMARLAGRSDLTDGEAIELACLFYIKGKLGRWLDAAVAGRPVGEDTVYDIGIYIKMAQRSRDVGSWPGVDLS